MKILYRNHNNNYSSPATDFFKIENHIFKTTTHLGLVFALIEISSWYYQQPQKTNPKKRADSGSRRIPIRDSRDRCETYKESTA